VARGPVADAGPSREAAALQREADHQAAVAVRDVALRAALAAEADPLFFRWQRGEVTKADWLTAVVEVKARFPKPERA